MNYTLIQSYTLYWHTTVCLFRWEWSCPSGQRHTRSPTAWFPVATARCSTGHPLRSSPWFPCTPRVHGNESPGPCAWRMDHTGHKPSCAAAARWPTFWSTPLYCSIHSWRQWWIWHSICKDIRIKIDTRVSLKLGQFW